MANYFVINSKFRPYSFDELIKPYQMYGEAYKEQETILNKLESDAATLASALSETNDRQSFITYKNYLDKVKAAADDIAVNGLNANTRRRAATLASSYNSDIVPIQAAFTRRRELQDEQRKALLADNSLMFQRNFGTISPESSIDRFVENPNYDYGRVISGNALTDQVAKIAGNLAKELSEYGPGRPLDKFTNTFLQRHGFSSTQVLDAINNPDRATSQPILNAIVESAVGSSGVKEWGSPDVVGRAYDFARKGLWYSVGQTSVSPYDNYGAKLAAQLQQQKNLIDYKGRQDTLKGIPINPMNIYTPNEISEIGKNIRKYSKYFDTRPDGSVVLNEAGRKEYEKGNAVARIGTAGGTELRLDSGFRNFIDSLMGDGKSENLKMSIETAWQNYLKDNDPERWDATKTTEYDYRIKESQQEPFKKAIITAAAGNNLRAVEYDANTHTWKDTGDELKLSEFADKKYTVTSTRMSSSGTQIIVQDGSGKTYRFTMPRNINPVNEFNRDNALKRADILRDAIVNENYSNLAEYQQLLNDYNEALQSAYLYHSQLGVTYDTKPEEFNPYVF